MPDNQTTEATVPEASIFTAEHALRETVRQAIGMIDAAKKYGDPNGAMIPALRRLLRGGLNAADALTDDGLT